MIKGRYHSHPVRCATAATNALWNTEYCQDAGMAWAREPLHYRLYDRGKSNPEDSPHFSRVLSALHYYEGHYGRVRIH